METTKTLLKENGVNLMLTVVDTPGFGDAVDNSDWWVLLEVYGWRIGLIFGGGGRGFKAWFVDSWRVSATIKDTGSHSFLRALIASKPHQEGRYDYWL